MKKIKYIILLIMIISLMGCATGKGLLDEIPMAEFDFFEYDRGGNATSMHITATSAKKIEGGIVIKSVNIKADYGPFVNFRIKLEGYKRDYSKFKNK